MHPEAVRFRRPGVALSCDASVDVGSGVELGPVEHWVGTGRRLPHWCRRAGGPEGSEGTPKAKAWGPSPLAWFPWDYGHLLQLALTDEGCDALTSIRCPSEPAGGPHQLPDREIGTFRRPSEYPTADGLSAWHRPPQGRIGTGLPAISERSGLHEHSAQLFGGPAPEEVPCRPNAPGLLVGFDNAMAYQGVMYQLVHVDVIAAR